MVGRRHQAPKLSPFLITALHVRFYGHASSYHFVLAPRAGSAKKSGGGIYRASDRILGPTGAPIPQDASYLTEPGEETIGAVIMALPHLPARPIGENPLRARRETHRAAHDHPGPRFETIPLSAMVRTVISISLTG